MTYLPKPHYMQICWVVPDLYAAIETWSQQAGVGPFFVFDEVTYENAVYRGQPWKPVRFHAAIAQANDMQIELVSQLEDGPSMFSELVPPGQSRLHHMSTYTHDFEADLEHYRKTGADVVFSGLMKGAPVCWLDTVDTLGFMTELITANPEKEKVFAMFKDAARNWDGKDPIRRL